MQIPISVCNRLKAACQQDTSADPNNWVPENPLWGHCAVVALLLQDIYGGALIRASLEHIPELAYVRSHYANKLNDGTILDSTAEQFLNRNLSYPKDLIWKPCTRESLVSNELTLQRYRLLSNRFNRLPNS